MAFLQDLSNQLDLREEARSPKHLRQHHAMAQNKLAGTQSPSVRGLLPASAQPQEKRSAVGGRRLPAQSDSCTMPAKTEPRHGENHSFVGCFPPTAEIFAPTALKSLRKNSTFFFFFQSTIFHFSMQRLNQPKPTQVLHEQTLTARLSPCRTESLPAWPHPAAPRRTISLNPR